MRSATSLYHALRFDPQSKYMYDGRCAHIRIIYLTSACVRVCVCAFLAVPSLLFLRMVAHKLRAELQLFCTTHKQTHIPVYAHFRADVIKCARARVVKDHNRDPNAVVFGRPGQFVNASMEDSVDNECTVIEND